jgi:urease accessory protein
VSGWTARLELDYRRDGERTIAHHRHEGPLRVLKALHPEGPGICHHVIVHPPGGIVGGDELKIELDVGPGAHALITTPGAARYYRSGGAAALQRVALSLAAGARCEWLPLETIAYPGCRARSEIVLALAPGAEVIGWDLLALGLPAAGAGFDHGCYEQSIAWPGVWLEQGRIDAADRILLDGPVGLAGRRVLGLAWLAAGDALAPARREALGEAARAALAGFEGLPGQAWVGGATSPDPRLWLVRMLADRCETALLVLQAVRAAWRRLAWDLPAAAPRVWRT